MAEDAAAVSPGDIMQPRPPRPSKLAGDWDQSCLNMAIHSSVTAPRALKAGLFSASNSAIMDLTAAGEIEITAQEMREFQCLFRDWQTSFPTCDQLEIGGDGDLVSLVGLILPWAMKVASRRSTRQGN
jgi:hypothetical protein